jgi:hypothetical protein
MPRYAFLLVALLLGTFAACGGGDNTSDAGSDATTSDAPSDGLNASDAADSHVPVLDACVAIDGGAACDPGHVVCGSTKCTAGVQLCCIEDGGFTCVAVDAGGGGPPPPPPPPPGGACSGGTKAFCDEAANCPDAEVCCGFVGSGGGYATSCQPSCPGLAIQFCHGSAECVTGTCVGQTCSGEYVETCGPIAECLP